MIPGNGIAHGRVFTENTWVVKLIAGSRGLFALVAFRANADAPFYLVDRTENRQNGKHDVSKAVPKDHKEATTDLNRSMALMSTWLGSQCQITREE